MFDLGRGQGMEGLLQSGPKVIMTLEYLTGQLLAHQRPNMLYGVHIWRIWWPDSPIEHVKLLGLQEFGRGLGLVYTGSIMLELVRT